MKRKMNKPLYLIKYENAHWCGGGMQVVVVAESCDEAVYLAEDHMWQCQAELFSSEYEEDPCVDECNYVIESVEPFGPEHEEWQYFQDPSQAEFYPVVGKL